MLLISSYVSGAAQAASLGDFSGVWAYSPQETHALLVISKNPDLAKFGESMREDEKIFLRIDTDNKTLTITNSQGRQNTIPFIVKAFTDNRLTIMLIQRPAEKEGQSVNLTLVSGILLHSDIFQNPVAFVKEKIPSHQVNEPALQSILGSWGPDDSGEWRVNVERKPGADSDGVIYLAIPLDIEEEKRTFTTVAPFRLDSATTEGAILHILPAAPLVISNGLGRHDDLYD